MNKSEIKSTELLALMHDVTSPVNSIIGSCEALILIGNMSNDALKLISGIIGEADRLKKIHDGFYIKKVEEEGGSHV